MTMNIQVKVFWVVTLCCVAVEYHHFGGPCCLHLHGEECWCSAAILQCYKLVIMQHSDLVVHISLYRKFLYVEFERITSDIIIVFMFTMYSIQEQFFITYLLVNSW
jgi:hypothetical protein